MSQNNFKFSNPFQFGLLGGLGVLTALLIGGMLTTVTNIITYVFAALFIALGLDPVVSFLESKGIKRPLGILIVITALIAVATAIIMVAAPELIAQTTTFIESLPAILADVTKLPWVQSLDRQFDGGLSRVLDGVSSTISDSANWPTLLGGVVQFGITLFNGFTGGLIILILSLYFMASLGSFKNWIYLMVPASRRSKFADIAEQIADSIGRYVLGQVTIALINSCFALLIMLILGVKFAIVLAFIAFLLALIPLVGSLSAAGIITLVTLASNPINALFFLIAYFAYMQVEAYFISPRVMSKAVAVPGALVVVAALTGGALLGVLGALVAIPVAASAILILRQVWLPHQEAR